MTIGSEIGQGIKYLGVVKDLPLWVLTALALALDVFIFVPQLSADCDKSYWLWMKLAAIVINALFLGKLVTVVLQWWYAYKISAEGHRTFHLTPLPHQCNWSVSKQADDSFITQLSAHLMVKNRCQSPVGLVAAHIVKPLIGQGWLGGEVVHELILVRAVHGNMYGTAQGSDHCIPAGMMLPAQVTIMLRGKPDKQVDEKLSLLLAVRDGDGNEQRVRIAFRGFSTLPASNEDISLEAPFKITDPIEKEVVSILQAELTRYDKCGRSVGGLGSVHLTYRNQAMRGVGGDSWEANSSRNQSIADDPEFAVLHSDNLEALLALHERSSEGERTRLVMSLISRLEANKGYLRISYFIFCTLWHLGHFSEAIVEAKKVLPQSETEAFGLSNVLLLLNGLLRYRYPDFTPNMLDEIEEFIHGLKEHTFMIGEKIAAIRAKRLRDGTNN